MLLILFLLVIKCQLFPFVVNINYKFYNYLCLYYCMLFIAVKIMTKDTQSVKKKHSFRKHLIKYAPYIKIFMSL